MSSRILIVYGTQYGQTTKIAARIRGLLATGGHDITLVRGDALPRHFSLEAYDAVIVGVSLVMGGYQRYMRRFVHEHRGGLADMPTAFFAVSGSAGSAFPEHREEARHRMETFLEKAGWQPDRLASFAGAVTYTKYNALVRWIMKRISRKEGGSTDTSRDHEYTDWARVERFADDFEALVRERAEAASAVRR